jgi:5'-3' exonuclease
MAVEIRLIDFSSIIRPAYIAAPQDCVTNTLDRVRSLAADNLHTAICCDSERSLRKDLDPRYKAQRPETDAPLWHAQAVALEELKYEGFPVWKEDGYEADDIIASATLAALTADPNATVRIITADKDLLQLVNPRVVVQALKNGTVLDEEYVRTLYGITPGQMTDWLSLVGDNSDNVIGAKGIGPKKATALLQEFGNIKSLYDAMDRGEASLQRATQESLLEFRERWPLVRQLISLHEEVEVPFAEVAAERTPHEAPGDVAGTAIAADAVRLPPVPSGGDSGQPPSAPAPVKNADTLVTDDASPAVLPAPPPQEWGRQLEPRSIGEASRLAQAMFIGRMFNGYGNPQAVLATILAGRELNMNTVASLRAFHIIDGKMSLAADAMRALVLRSGNAKYFRCTERTAEHCTWETWRIGDPEQVRLTYTIEQAKLAWQKDERAWKLSAWGRMPEDMLSARASSKLARLVYADILYGLYAPEELRDEVTGA